MFLKNLQIKSKNQVIRNVTFKRGVNLILDETTKTKTESGNDVGKTTFLRVIDYCLGANGEDIYTDKEFKKKNTKVFDFLNSKEVMFELSLEDNNKNETLIKRSFAGHLEINGQLFEEIEVFNDELRKLLFKTNSPKPSFRQLINKFLRIDDYQLTNTLKCLFPATPDSTYEMLYLFLFGFKDHDLLIQRHNTNNALNNLRSKLNAIKKNESKSALNQAVSILKKEIKEEESKSSKFELNEVYDEQFNELKELREKISPLSVHISNLEMNLNLSEKSVTDLKNSISKLDLNVIEEIYNEAKALLPNINKSVEDAISFYNKMILKKVEFINTNIKKISSSIKEKRADLKKLLTSEKELLQSLSNSGSLADLQKLEKKLRQLHEQKGQKEALIELMDEIGDDINDTRKNLKEIEEKIHLHFDALEDNLKVFNDYFSDYSKRLYGVSWLLFFDAEAIRENKKEFGFEFTNLDGNVGSGKKKSLNAVFDLAYISFLNKLNSDTVKFVIHDQCELVHSNQIETLFKIAEEIDGQFILPILRDKVSKIDPKLIEAVTRLTLSEKDKLFKVE